MITIHTHVKSRKLKKFICSTGAGSGEWEGLRGQETWSLKPPGVQLSRSRTEGPLPYSAKAHLCLCHAQGWESGRCSQKTTSSEDQPTPRYISSLRHLLILDQRGNSLIPLRKGKGKSFVTIILNWVRDIVSSSIPCPSR